MLEWNASFDVPLIYASVCLYFALVLANYVIRSIRNEYYNVG